MLRLALLASLTMAAPALAQAPKLLDCGIAKDAAWCRQAQAQYRSEASGKANHASRRNLAYCLWTGCDQAFAIDRKASCLIRREIMKRYPKDLERSDEQHFANCVNAGY